MLPCCIVRMATMIQAKLYNIKLLVRNLEESVAFYTKVFSWLGFTRGRYWDDPYDQQKAYTLGNNHMYMELFEGSSSTYINVDEKSIKGARIEFFASSKDEVDEFYSHLLKNNVVIIEEPKRYFDELWESCNMSDAVWYAVYFLDPNGIKFGLVYTND